MRTGFEKAVSLRGRRRRHQHAERVAWAHHSFAMFDSAKKIDVKGTVKDVQWTNPHVWVDLVVTDGGKQETYGFEGGAVAVLRAVRLDQEDLVKAGDAITLTAHPFKDGRPGGSIDFVT